MMQLSNNKIPDLFVDSYSQSVIESLITNRKSQIQNVRGSALAFFVAQSFKTHRKPTLLILSDKEEAAYCYNDLQHILGDEKVHFFPSSYKRFVQEDQIDKANIVLRTEVLSTLNQRGSLSLIVTYPEALAEKIITKKEFSDRTFKLNTGEQVSPDFVQEFFEEYGFNKVDFVTQPGEYSIRGSIIDVFSFSDEVPYRIDFFDEEIESLRIFDVGTQTSNEKVKKISIIPNIHENTDTSEVDSFFNFLGEQSVIVIQNINYCFSQIESFWQHSDSVNKVDLEKILITKDEFCTGIQRFRFVEINDQSYLNPEYSVSLSTESQPVFRKNFDLLVDDLLSKIENGYKIYISSQSYEQIKRLESIFNDKDLTISFNPVYSGFSKGFVDNRNKICFYTDHQIFDRYHRYHLKDKFNNSYVNIISEINQLNPGDYIVHVDHGIGIFGGLERIEINGKQQEAIKLIYKDNDILYVNIHSLHRISKYKAKTEAAPKIYKLGTGAWQRLKQNTKSKVKDIARELIELYARRMEQKGFSFSADTYLNKELEASFFYEDTPDQIKATKLVKENMEKDVPMDVLVCGDVGFGKTEIAIRAAFKAVCDNKQVAVLVPTTILALQHYRTFRDRLSDFPCEVEYISRLRSSKKNNDVKKRLCEGKVDIVIGTHMLTGKNVVFKDLGLMIIDEEQKFGVSIKEKLKQLKINIDTLTLTATPIPRTLQFSLMGARDLCILNTPPPNRHPIITELHTFNGAIIKQAIEYEIERQGQVYYINNRIQGIKEIEMHINKLCPGVKTAVVHGQMNGSAIENIMTDFIDGNYGVLIATSIIENGLDIPNVNTIIINDAHLFGLSDLHQLRGRVGRSNKKAFCYLLAPPLNLMTPDARKRLRAIVEYSELGSGFNISLQDLDIRGAGNMLGAEQSGFIADIGFETYQRILNEAIQELREKDFKDYFVKGETTEKDIREMKFVSDCVIDTDLQLLFPESYISNIPERIKLYKQLDNIQNESELEEFQTALKDRFGSIPNETLELIQIVKLRWLAVELGIEKIIMKNNQMVCYFLSQQDSLFYQSNIFAAILNYLQKSKEAAKMKEHQDKLSLSFYNVDSIQDAIRNLKKITDSYQSIQDH